MVVSSDQIGPFQIEVDADGVGVVTFDRPPVNAVTLEVYEAIAKLVERISPDDSVRAVIVTAPPEARAWCGGADLGEFVGMTPKRRKERYQRINELIPGLLELERPTIAAINAHTVGIGVVLASLCDMRVAADTATFACREIDVGLVPGEGGLLAGLGVPRVIVREMLFTGRRFSAAEMQAAGYLNAVVPREAVLERSREIAVLAAAKSLPALKLTKRIFNSIEGLGWSEAYELSQDASTLLTPGPDAAEGVNAFLEHRSPKYVDR